MKRLTALALLLCFFLCSCGEITPAVTGRLSIVCSSFPAYDFSREIAGDRADIYLLIKPGAEVHSYEPSPKEVARIRESDLFVCNGGESEAWLEGLITDSMNVLYMTDCVETVAEEEKEGMYIRGEEDEEEEELDEHVWTSPVNAILISEEICSRLCAADPENSEYYVNRCGDYTEKLTALHEELLELTENAEVRTLVFADRFPMRYFTREYGLDYFAAFPGCSSETEPSAKTVAFLIDRVREAELPAVLYMEFSNQKMADVICEDTGCKKLPFYSAHNVTAEQFEAGVSYLDLMTANIQTLKEALYRCHS